MKSIFIIFFAVFVLVIPNAILASALDDGLSETAIEATLATEDERDADAERLVAAKIGSIIQTVLSVIGLVFMIIVMYGGLLWMIGGSTNVGKAKNIIIYSALGLIIIAMSYAAVNFVVETIGQEF
ncbi:TPA: hypothetical protein DF272_00500 [Candidatus Falkowbacteria bacterium]|nr:hypothetical protein [Candidatus Falkowbacteria bacterium]